VPDQIRTALQQYGLDLGVKISRDQLDMIHRYNKTYDFSGGATEIYFMKQVVKRPVELLKTPVVDD